MKINITKEQIKAELLNLSLLTKTITGAVAGCSYLFENHKLAFIVMIIGAVADHLINRFKK